MAGFGIWCRVALMAPGGVPLRTWVVSGIGAPDLGLVEYLARLQLAATRAGGMLVVDDFCDTLTEILDLTGLRRQVCGQLEEREEPLRVQKRMQARDPPA